MVNNLPPGLPDGFYCSKNPDGTFRVHMIEGGRSLAHTDCDESSLGKFAAYFLDTARVLGTPTVPEERFDGIAIQGATPSLVTHQMPSHETLAFRFGKAQIGFVLPHPTLRGLGQALIAASVSSDQRN